MRCHLKAGPLLPCCALACRLACCHACLPPTCLPACVPPTHLQLGGLAQALAEDLHGVVCHHQVQFGVFVRPNRQLNLTKI